MDLLSSDAPWQTAAGYVAFFKLNESFVRGAPADLARVVRDLNSRGIAAKSAAIELLNKEVLGDGRVPLDVEMKLAHIPAALLL
jgi:hypothetical protein